MYSVSLNSHGHATKDKSAVNGSVAIPKIAGKYCIFQDLSKFLHSRGLAMILVIVFLFWLVFLGICGVICFECFKLSKLENFRSGNFRNFRINQISLQ